MVNVKDIYKFIDNIAPFDNSMDFDNCGLLVGDFSSEVKKVLLALDITTKVVMEAKKIGANLIISHHPVIFKPIKSLYSDSVPYLLAKNSISAICAHTNLDMAPGGVNDCLADSLKLKNRTPLSVYKEKNYNKIVVFVPSNYTEILKDSMSKAGAGTLREYSGCGFKCSGMGSFIPLDDAKPFIGNPGIYQEVEEDRLEMICPPDKIKDVISAIKESHPYEKPAFDIFETSSIKMQNICGLIGYTDDEFTPKEFAQHVKLSLNCSGVRYIEGNKPIKTVALCSGAGGNLIFNAIAKGVDAFLTGEIKHHEILAAMEAGITVVDASHFSTEDIVINPLISKLNNKFEEIDFIKSKELCNIIEYI